MALREEYEQRHQRTLTHRQLVERGSFHDCDGLLWFGSVQWPDGLMLNGMFWQYYAPLIQEQDHGRALRALIVATQKGMREFKTAEQFKDRMRATFDPFLKQGRRARSRAGECEYCGRPDAVAREQCRGCGAWKRSA